MKTAIAAAMLAALVIGVNIGIGLTKSRVAQLCEADGEVILKDRAYACSLEAVLIDGKLKNLETK